VTVLENALTDLARLLAESRIPYMVVGGIANAVWGEPRATLDIDVTLWVEEAAIPATVDILSQSFRPLVADPSGFIADTRVLPMESTDGVRIDVIFGMLPFEREAVQRAVHFAIAGVPVSFCTAEDLVLMKIISERERDLADARAVVARRLPELDLAYLGPRVAELSAILERPEILAHWRAWTGRDSG
jgi:hypothetical protein